MTRPIVQVLLGEMSAPVRRKVSDALAAERGIVNVGEVRPRDDVLALIRRLRPNLLVLGVEAAGRDPFETTKRVMAEAPTPIVLVTDGKDVDVDASVMALGSGALAVISAPDDRGAPEEAEAARRRFVASLTAMSQVKLVRRWRDRPASKAAVAAAPKVSRLIAIAASTGGPAALQTVLAALPRDFAAPILVVQHIAHGFTDGLVHWLNSECAVEVKVAVDGEPLRARTVYLAADGRHLGVSSRATIVLSDGPPVDGFRPAASYLFESAAKGFGAGLTAVVLTGMGRDGAAGLRAVRKFGGEVIAQDEASSIVYGMPKAAYETGMVDQVLPLGAVAPRLIATIEGRS